MLEYPAERNGLKTQGTAPAKVLLAHNYYQMAGGEDIVVASERALLESRGHKVSLYQVDNHRISNVFEKTKAFLNIAYSSSSRDAFARELSSVRPDIVHVHNFFPLLTTSIYDACRDAGVPVVQTLHNYRIACAGALLQRDGKVCEKCIGASPYWGAVHRCYRGSAAGSFAVARMIHSNQRRGTWCSKVDCLIALTQSAKHRFVRSGVPAERIAVKPNFASDPGDVQAGRRHGALFVGRLSPEKGVREIIEAWKNVDYPLRIAGDGPLAGELRCNAPPIVTFLGQISASEVRREMASAALLIMYSTWLEGFPVVLTEAFSVGLPAVVSDIGAPPEIVEHGKTGIHVRASAPQALASAINDVIRDPARLNQLGRAARETYVAKYSPEVNYRQLIAIYDRMRQSPIDRRL